MLRNVGRLFRIESETEKSLKNCEQVLHANEIDQYNLKNYLKDLRFRLNQISMNMQKLEEGKKEDSNRTITFENHFGVRNSDGIYR